MEDKFIKLLEKFLLDIDTIDGDTPWQEREPDWWCDMMEVRAVAQKILNGYDK